MRRQQQELPLYAGYGAPPGYVAPPSRRPVTQGSGNGGGHLPSIVNRPTNVVLPVGVHQQETGLGLDIKAMPTVGNLPVHTVPRLHQGPDRNMLSSSDTTSDRLRQARKGYMPPGHGAEPATVGERSRSERRRFSQPNVVLGPPSTNRRGSNPLEQQQQLQLLSGHLRGLEGSKTATMATSNPLPPIAVKREGLTDSDEEISESVEVDQARTESSVSDETDETDEEDYIDTASEAPPSRPGFESESEKSVDILQAPFPKASASNQFPVTLHQDQEYVSTQRFSATVSSTGISHRVNNVVRAFEIHGQLDKRVLTDALNKVAKLHPLLSASFLMKHEKLYAETNQQNMQPVELDTPVVGHEHADDLILNARRKLFPIPVQTCTTPTLDSDALTSVLSVASITNSAENSPTIPSTKHSSRKRTVSFATDPPSDVTKDKDVSQDSETTRNSHLPHLPPIVGVAENSADKQGSRPLLRAKLVSVSSARHTLVLSFPRIVCDFWSSCLFVQQLADCYGVLEKSANYRPSLAALKAEKKRQGVLKAYEKERRKNNIRDPAASLLKRRAAATTVEVSKEFAPMVSARVQFQQVALRERQLLLMAPRENLSAFWEAIVTTTIKRSRGTSRLKMVPPVRIPSGLGEKLPGLDLGPRGRPQTSRLRPLTASRNRPMTGRRQMGGAVGDIGMSREALLGPKNKFHFIKIEDVVCEEFNQLFSEMHRRSTIRSEDHLCLFALGVYILLLARCCRGWGQRTNHTHLYNTARDAGLLSARLRKAGLDFSPGGSRERLPQKDSLTAIPGRFIDDEGYSPAVGIGDSPRMRGQRRGAKLDVGTFLLGVEVSLRHSEPEDTEGLFGPLTNDVGIRVTLSSSETFVDFLGDLSRTLTLANRHGHHPFQPIAEEFGLAHGLPVKFSFLRHSEVIQLSNPNDYFYVDTAVGVVKKGLSRIGSNCFLMPINSKMDDDTHLELVLWESYDLNDSLAGGFRYQPQVIRTELVESFGTEFCRLLAVVASNPAIPILELAALMYPPFVSGHSKRKKTARRFV